MAGLTIVDNASLMLINGPKTPSPLPKSKVLDVADELLSFAEKEFASLESKKAGPLLSSRSSARNTNGSISTKRTMTDLQVSPTKSSLISESKLKSGLKTIHQVPQNSPSSSKSKDEENYYHNNGETKVAKPKPCLHQRQLKSVCYQHNQSKPNSQRSDLSENQPPALSHFSMFYEQQQLVERSSQKVKENSSTTVIFTSDAKVVGSTNAALKQDVQTNTEAEDTFQPRNLQRYTPNSSIISMKTSKPEETVELEYGPQKILNVQKMPSVNIRPEFTVQQGPKINIAASNSVSFKPKRKNTEYFDVVYPPRIPVLSTENKFVSNDSNLQYVCDRHIFPSGVLIPSSQNAVTRNNHEEENYSFDEQKSLLVSLIRLLAEKIEKQPTNERKSCCRLVFSLPLLASVVSKIQVNCVNCLNLLNKQLTILVQLMKEELRSQRNISEDHCCKLDETIRYQIVELELMQDENLTKQSSKTLKIFKHQEKEERHMGPKKSVSFESLPNAPEQSASLKNYKTVEKSGSFRRNTSKNINSKTFDTKSHSAPSEKSRNTIYKKNIVGDLKETNKVYKEQIKNKISSVGINTNKPLKNSSGSEDRTIVGKVVKSLHSKKSILKSDSTPHKPPIKSSNDTKENLNALFEVVDEQENSREFDFWIKERSLKIKKIHEELNKLVEGSTEKYVQAQPIENNWLERPETSEENGTQSVLQEVNLYLKEAINSSEKYEVKKSDYQIAEAVTQEDVIQDYVEDFEEDVEELSNNNKSEEDSFHKTQAEVENGFSSSGSEEILTDEERIKDSTYKSRSVDDKLNSESQLEAASLVDSSLDETSVQSIEEASSKKTTSNNVTKVDIATSPINFESSANISLDTELPKHNVNKTLKTSIALSPINVQKTHSSAIVSSSAQTVISGSKLFMNASPECQVNDSINDNIPSLLPTTTLVSTPMENVLKFVLDTTEENSLSLQTKLANQTMSLTVQLPDQSVKNKGNKQILKLEDVTQKPEIKEELISQIHDLTTKTERNFSSIKDNMPSSSKNEYEHVNSSYFHTLKEKTVKDIIEPTVSEVLKQIHDNKINSSSSAQYLDEVDNREITNPLKHAELTKPNIFLQTKHNLWKKCEDYHLSNFADLGSPKQTMDSSNQTEAEKQNVHVQVAASLTGSVSDKGISARKHDNLTSALETSYLTILQPPPPLSETVMSSVSCSSSHHSSSGSSSSSIFSSKSNGDVSVQTETLSEGEVITGYCICKTGDVCPACVPRLDLSFGELKTKKKHNKPQSASSNDSSCDFPEKNYDPRVLLNMPLHLEPRPPSFIRASVSGIKKTLGIDLISQKKLEANKEHSQVFSNFQSNVTNKGNYIVSKHFSEVANSVITELNEEYLKSNMAYSKAGSLFPRPIQSVNTPSTSNQIGFHSSTDSEKSGRLLHKSKKCSPGSKSKFKTSLVIKSPLETPRIDMVIEKLEADSLSSYQTSVTSVSVDNLASLTSHSSGELHHHSEESS